MPRRRLPPFVQVLWADRAAGKVRGYRGWWAVGPKRVFGATHQDPLQAHAQAVAMRKAVQAMPADGGTFGTLADEWLDGAATRLAPDTIDYYRSRLKNVFRTIPPSTPVERITPAVLRQFVRDAIDQHKLGGRTIQHCRRMLNTFFGWLRRRGTVRDNPVPMVDWPKPENTEPDVMSEVELVGHLARITEPWAAALAMFLAYTGLRRAEMAKLRRDAIDLVGGVLWIRGKSRSQSHPLPDDAIAAAKVLLAHGEGDFVVAGATDRGRREKIAETFRRWQRILKEPRWHPHALRHSVATIMLRKGASPATVQRFLRHSSYAMTQRYVHMVEDDVRNATAKLRLLGGESDREERHG